MSKFIIALSIVLVIILVLSFFIILNKHVVPNLHQSFCNDTYHFFPNSSEDRRFSLEILNDDGTAEVILENCDLYKITNHQVFGISKKEGYGIINLKTKKCKVYITLPRSEVFGWLIDDEEEIYRQVVENELIYYLNSYEEFDEVEQEVFEKMKKTK